MILVAAKKLPRRLWLLLILYATDHRLHSQPHTTKPSSMANPQSIWYSLCSLLLFLACADALKFDVEAHSQGDKKGERCIRNFVAKDTLVVVTAIVDGHKGDGMVVNMHVSLMTQLWKRNMLMVAIADQGCSRK